MAEQYVRSYVRGDNGSEFVFDNGFEIDRDGIPIEELQHTIPSGNTDGADGEHQSLSRLAARTFVLKGTVKGDGPSDLQQKLDGFFGAFPKGSEGMLRRKIVDGATVLSDRYLACRVAYRAKGPETGLPYNKWELGFRAAVPLYCDFTPQPDVALPTAGGSAAIVWGGQETVLPVVTLTVTAPGTIGLQEGSPAAGYITFTAAATGTYSFDAEQRLLTFVPTGSSGPGAAQNAITAVTAGGFFEMVPYATTLTLVLSGGATVSAASVRGRRRWPFS